MTASAPATSSHAAGAPPRRTPTELCMIADVSKEASALAAGAPGHRELLALLVDRGLFPDAVRILAHVLPRREAVWWAWACSRKAAGAEPPAPIQAALEATERWIVQPTEEHRREALPAGEAADFGTAAGSAALAAFMTGGSLAPPGSPAVPPGEFLCAKAVAGSITLAVVTSAPEKPDETFAEFLRLGLEVAERTKVWGPA